MLLDDSMLRINREYQARNREIRKAHQYHSRCKRIQNIKANLMALSIVAPVLVVITALSNLDKINVQAKSNSTYPQAMEIVSVDEEQDLVYIATASGVVYSFYGIEDYYVNDIVAVIMDDNGTESVYDDIIVDCQYSGYWRE